MRAWRRGLAVLVGAALGGFSLLTPALAQVGPSGRGHAAIHASGPATGQILKEAKTLVECGRWKRARSLLNQALSRPEHRDDAPLMSYYGHVLIQFGELDTASKLTKRALSIDQDCASCHLYRFEAMADRAKTMSHLRAMFQIPKMESELKTAYKLNPRLGDIQWGWIDLYLYLPATLGGGAGPARAHAEKLLAIDPVDGHLALAEIAKQQNDPTKELAQYRAAERQDTSDPRGAFALGKALYERGQYREAESYLSRAFALNHDSALYSAYRAADLVHLHRIEAAHHVVAVGNQTHPDSRLGDYLVAKALKAIDADLPWARELLASYLGVPPEPDQPTRSEARSLLAAIG